MSRPWTAWRWCVGAAVLGFHAWTAWALQQTAATPFTVPAQPPLAVRWISLPISNVASTSQTLVIQQQRSIVPQRLLQPARTTTTPISAPTMAATEQPATLQMPQAQSQESVPSAVAPELSAATKPDASSVNTTTPPQAAPPKLIPPSLIRYIEPPTVVYPTASRRLGEFGTVVVRVYVDEAGLPRAVQVAQSSGFMRLDAAAVAAVQQTRFVPYMENGQATAGWARIPFPFELERSR